MSWPLRRISKSSCPSTTHRMHIRSSTMAASSVQEQDLIVLGRRPQAPQQPQQQAASSAADPQQARMQAAMRTRPDGSLENVQASPLQYLAKMPLILGAAHLRHHTWKPLICHACTQHEQKGTRYSLVEDRKLSNAVGRVSDVAPSGIWHQLEEPCRSL